jgi:hypothetical protein
MTAFIGLLQCGQRLASMVIPPLFRDNAAMEQKFPSSIGYAPRGRVKMQAAIDRVMHTYGMIVNLSLEEERAAREKVSSHLAERPNASEQELAVEGLRYLRSVKDLG